MERPRGWRYSQMDIGETCRLELCKLTLLSRCPLFSYQSYIDTVKLTYDLVLKWDISFLYGDCSASHIELEQR